MPHVYIYANEYEYIMYIVDAQYDLVGGING